MKWLPITDSLPRDACPRCDRGELYVRSSRPTGDRWQVQYLWCTNCLATFKARVERRQLARAPKAFAEHCSISRIILVLQILKRRIHRVFAYNDPPPP